MIAYHPSYPSIDDLRARARRRIPRFAFEYLDGGCNEDVNLDRNTRELREVQLRPQYLRPFTGVRLDTELFGHTYSAPFGIAPIGLQGLIWPGAPRILARAAREANIPFILSTVTTASIEEIAEITEGRCWYQLYHPAEDRITEDILKRLESAGVEVLVLLCDVPSFGFRPRDIRNGLSMPPRMTLRNIAQMLGCPAWGVQMLRQGIPQFATMKRYMPDGMSMKQLGLYMNRTFDGRLSEEKVARLRARWKGKLVLKGVAGSEDAAAAVRLGLDGLIVSNHGGRQLDAGESSIRSLESIVADFAGRIPLMVDSGLRDGPDVARAMAVGADFTFLGRSFMYGVAALGNAGGRHTIELIRAQLKQVMEQVNCAHITGLPQHRVG
ncbi:alpha-hydroxy acid oxidase [Flaviaesturariibacter amylovorans]|uniref:Alpha-hydroxy-acid oxidizing protein n=1 Tax=Flaviaesturariibacter amylovorans TaxID=1084520 RepID=A0ABP8H6Q2_9BACT